MSRIRIRTPKKEPTTYQQGYEKGVQDTLKRAYKPTDSDDRTTYVKVNNMTDMLKHKRINIEFFRVKGSDFTVEIPGVQLDKNEFTLKEGDTLTLTVPVTVEIA